MVPAGPPRRPANAALDAIIPTFLMVIALGVVCALAVLLVTPVPPVETAPPPAEPPTATPDSLARDLMAAQATWYAPQPTATAAPTPTRTAGWQPTAVIWCGPVTRPGTTCKWPPPPPPTPTPYPACNTPVPNAVCVWGKP